MEEEAYLESFSKRKVQDSLEMKSMDQSKILKVEVYLDKGSPHYRITSVPPILFSLLKSIVTVIPSSFTSWKEDETFRMPRLLHFPFLFSLYMYVYENFYDFLQPRSSFVKTSIHERKYTLLRPSLMYRKITLV